MAAGEQRVFYYQRPTANQCFVLGLTSPFMLRAAAKAHGKALLMDATFGMNHHKVWALSVMLIEPSILTGSISRPEKSGKQAPDGFNIILSCSSLFLPYW